METTPVFTDWNHAKIEAIELESKDFDRARELSDRIVDEANQWQLYLNTLAFFSLEKWLQERSPELRITREDYSLGEDRSTQHFYARDRIKVEQFKFCILAAETFFDRVVPIPQVAIDIPEWVAHFYVAIEVLEERQQAIIRGFIRYDKLIAYQQTERLQVDAEHCYLIPISEWETQLDRLLLNLRFLAPSAIPLPTAEPSISKLVQLTQWLENILDMGWQTVDTLLGTEALALSFRTVLSPNRVLEVKGAKLIDLGLEVSDRALVLLVAITPEADEKIGIRIQVHPSADRQYLPANLELKMLSQTGETVQEVRSRDRDTYVQLRYFKTPIGTHFSICVALGDRSVTEAFLV
jgi:Protein of unknown function (DUF1822)